MTCSSPAKTQELLGKFILRKRIGLPVDGRPLEAGKSVRFEVTVTSADVSAAIGKASPGDALGTHYSPTWFVARITAEVSVGGEEREFQAMFPSLKDPKDAETADGFEVGGSIVEERAQLIVNMAVEEAKRRAPGGPYPDIIIDLTGELDRKAAALLYEKGIAAKHGKGCLVRVDRVLGDEPGGGIFGP